MNDCGCCAGITLATPAPVSNQPGLDAITRRAGTHGRFLDSMLARLSSPAYPELAGLRARTADDLAIALLDSWAAIADILTFYTERIANEGYLRTATEPESIARLGRLVGFTPRPGLGASVFLAYTLLTDPARDTAVTIPAGARAQSVPGPGELPQSYETGADLPSRASWNDLQVQRTAPVLISADTAGNLTDLHLAGTDTQVRPGDLLLLVFAGTGGTRPVAVQSVTPDTVANRTTIRLFNDSLSQNYSVTVRKLTVAFSAFAKAMPPPAAAGFFDYLKSLAKTVGISDLTLGKLLGLTPEDLLKLIGLIQAAIAEELAFAGLHGQAAAVTEWLSPLPGPLDAARQAAQQLLATRDPAGVAAHRRPGPAPPSRTSGPSSGCSGNRRAWPPATPFDLGRSPADRFAAGSDAAVQLLIAADPRLADTLYDAWSRQQIGALSPLLSLQHLRITAAPFGATAPHKQPPPQSDGGGGGVGLQAVADTPDWPLNETATQLALDTVYDGIVAGSWVVIQRSDPDPLAATTVPQTLVTTVTKVATVARAKYGITGRATQITLSDRWLPYDQTDADSGATSSGNPILYIDVLRSITVRVLSVPLPLSPVPVTDDIDGDTIDLDRLYPGLQPGRWLIVSGERTDIPGTAGVQAAELVMLAGVNQVGDPTLPGETAHSQLLLAAPLGYTYRRGSVHIAGNIASATQGETKTETLGSGDAGQAGQAFTLKQSPLTWLPAATPAGAADTLEVRVDGVRWHLVDTLAGSARPATTTCCAPARTGATASSSATGSTARG